MDYTIVKAIHIIFVVSYFAGLFYIVRLFIYQIDAAQKPEPEKSILVKQLLFMQERLWNIITVPAFIIMLISGGYMLYENWSFLLKQPWMHVKLLFILILIIYHIWSWRILKSNQKEKYKYSSVQLRMMNEVATLILFAVVFAVILKADFVKYWYWALLSFVALGALIMLIVKLVNKGKK